MAYCDVDNVQAEFKKIDFDADQAPIKRSTIEDWIDQADAEINVKLHGVYVVPITGNMSLTMVKQISIWIVKQRVVDVLRQKDGAEADKVGDYTNYGSRARNMLMDIRDRKLNLYDAVLITATDGIRSYSNDTLSEEGTVIGTDPNGAAIVVGQQHIFQRDTRQW